MIFILLCNTPTKSTCLLSMFFNFFSDLVIIFAGLLLLLIPLCLSLFTPFLFNNQPAYANNPWYGYHGRRKREIVDEINRKAKSFGLIDKDIDLDGLLPSASTVLNTITNLGKSIQNFSKWSSFNRIQTNSRFVSDRISGNLMHFYYFIIQLTMLI